jgi:hypothetical protein
MTCSILLGSDKELAKKRIITSHYTHSVPSGKSHYLTYEDAIIIWSIPANYNISRYLFGSREFTVWELSRLWAPDNHRDNLLTQSISASVKSIKLLEPVDAVVSYADPNAGHTGGVYRAASWTFHGQSEETRSYRGPNGEIIARRAFHSGSKGLKKFEIEALGYTQIKLPGKYRFVKPITRQAKRALITRNSDRGATA